MERVFRLSKFKGMSFISPMLLIQIVPKQYEYIITDPRNGEIYKINSVSVGDEYEVENHCKVIYKGYLEDCLNHIAELYKI